MPDRPAIPFFTDQNVPDSVGNTLIKAGHSVTRLRDVMDTKTADPVISVVCASNGQVLVSHDGDFRAIAKRLQITQRQYRQSLHRLDLRCPEPQAAARVGEALALIEYEWSRMTPACPMVIEIRDRSFVIHR